MLTFREAWKLGERIPRIRQELFWLKSTVSDLPSVLNYLKPFVDERGYQRLCLMTQIDRLYLNNKSMTDQSVINNVNVQFRKQLVLCDVVDRLIPTTSQKNGLFESLKYINISLDPWPKSYRICIPTNFDLGREVVSRLRFELSLSKLSWSLIGISWIPFLNILRRWPIDSDLDEISTSILFANSMYDFVELFEVKLGILGTKILQQMLLIKQREVQLKIPRLSVFNKIQVDEILRWFIINKRKILTQQ